MDHLLHLGSEIDLSAELTFNLPHLNEFRGKNKL